MRRRIAALVVASLGASLASLAVSTSAFAQGDPDEPGMSPSSSALASPTLQSDPNRGKPIPTSDQRVVFGLDLHAYGLFVPTGALDQFLTASQPLTSYGVGLGFVRRKGTFDIVLSLDVANFTFPTGSTGRGSAGGSCPRRAACWCSR